MSSDHGFESRRRARRRALQAVYQWQLTAQEAATIVRQFREAQDMNGVDVEYFERLLRGVAERREELDGALEAFLDRPSQQLDQMERAVLRLGAFELLHCPEAPFRVVIDECVDLSHRFGSEQGHSYVNAVLDRAAREWRPAEIPGAGG